MNNKYFLGVDIGTYESKGVIIDGDCKVIAVDTEKHGMENPKPNYFEHDADAVWWKDFCNISRALLSKSGISNKQIAAVGSSALGADLVPVDEHCRPLRKAILYGIDARADKEIDFLNNYYGLEEVLRFNGRPLCSNDIPPKILWLKNNEPQIFKKTYKLLTASSFVTAKLTGKFVIDRYLASGPFSPLYNPGTFEPDETYSEIFCRPDQLADVHESIDVVGEITAEAAKETGLAEGTPVITGTDDAAAEAISTGILDQGDLMVMFGSSLYLIGILDHVVNDNRIWSGDFIIPGTYNVEGGTNAAGTLTRWYRDNIFFDKLADEAGGGTNAYAAMTEGLENIPAGSDGLITLPYIAGERTPLNDPGAKGAIVGLSIRHTRQHLYRSALEAVGYSVAQHFDIFRENGMELKNVLAVGGGTKNSVWMQIIADITGINIKTAEVTIGASFGDAAMAALGIGHFGRFSELRKYIQTGREYIPNEQNVEIYKKYRRYFNELYLATRKFMD